MADTVETTDVVETTDQTTTETDTTLATDTTETASAHPADWPQDWRERMAGDDKDMLKGLQRLKSPLDVGKSWRNAAQKISGLKPAKPEGDDPEALAKWRQATGLPAEPDGYLENLDGIVLGDEDKDLAVSFLKDMHAEDADPKLVKTALGWYQKLKEDRIVRQATQDKEFRSQGEDSLREEWGNEYRSNLTGMNSVLDTYGEDGLKHKLFAARYPDGTLVGNDPAFLKAMVGISREINPHGTVTPAAGQTVSQGIKDEIAQLKIEMADTKGVKYDYVRNPQKQARYRELLELEEKYASR